MNVLVTGSAGHLGEALMRTLPRAGHHPIGIDIKASAFTHQVGSIADREFVSRCIRGVDAVVHTATLHKPHVVTHSRQEFLDTNVTGTLNLLEEARLANVRAFVFTSTTSAFGSALAPTPCTRDDLEELATDAPSVIRCHVPRYRAVFAEGPYPVE